MINPFLKRMKKQKKPIRKLHSETKHVLPYLTLDMKKEEYIDY